MEDTDKTLVRLSTKTIKRWSDSSAVTANHLLAWLYVSPDAATRLAASSANGNGPERRSRSVSSGWAKAEETLKVKH